MYLSFKVACDRGRTSLCLMTSKVPRKGIGRLDSLRIHSEDSEFGISWHKESVSQAEKNFIACWENFYFGFIYFKQNFFFMMFITNCAYEKKSWII